MENNSSEHTPNIFHMAVVAITLKGRYLNIFTFKPIHNVETIDFEVLY